MKIIFNSIPEDIPETIQTLGDLAEFKSISTKGTAIAVNGTLVPSVKWNGERISNNDDILVITAAYGG